MTNHTDKNSTQHSSEEVRYLPDSLSTSSPLTPGQESDTPNPECTPKNRRPRRKFSVERKIRILEELDACTNSSDTRAILHREGLYSSQINKWRSERVAGTLCKNASKTQKQLSEITGRYALLEKELYQTRLRLQQAETIIEAQKKIASAFVPEMEFAPTERNGSSVQLRS